ncbi:hypothetical protein BDF22DRAFT_9046 [Syncephalis plumigaleata]|nr:hypothetical protein BDF22DRAFT_9046 [Syncephalis plumigaleata]
MAKRALQHSGISSRTTTTTTTTTATSMKSTDKSASGANKGNVRKQSSRRTLFTQHYSQDEVAAGLRSGQLVEGKLRVSQRSRSEAYVTVDGYEDYDIFIFGHSLRNRAMDGDTVAVALLTDQERKEAKKSKLNAEQQRRQRYGDGDVVGGGGSLNEPSLWGKVVGIVYSNTQRLFVGTLSKTRVTQDTSNNDDNNANTSASPVHWWFKPTDKLIPMMLVPNEQIPKQIQIVLNNTNAINNLLFTVKVTRWPLSHMNPLAQVVDLLGSPGQLETETKMLLINAQVRLAPFPQALLNSLPSLPWSIPDTELANRYDMRSFSVFTVDPATAKDLDDAISCTRNENGNYSIGVHIADVSHFVLPQTALDDEAQKRATTTYLVDKAIPMLPPLLCEQLCSLQPGVDRLAFSVIWHMTPEGKILDTWFGRTIIRSCCQLSYEHAQMAIEGNELPDDIKIDKSHSATQIAEDIRLFHKLAQGLRKQRYENGAVSIHSVKLSFDLDDQGSPIDCRVYERKESHFMIEEFMLLANISVAKRIAVTFPEQALLRRHAPPIARRMESFTELSQQLGYDIDGSSSSSLQESLASIKDPEIAHVLCCLCVKSMRRARYFCTGALELHNIIIMR